MIKSLHLSNPSTPTKRKRPLKNFASDSNTVSATQAMFQRSNPWRFLIFAWLLFYSPSLWAVPVVGIQYAPEFPIIAKDGQKGDGFGCSVSISGDVAIVGADKADCGELADTGAAYIFVQSGDTIWVERQKLTAGDAATGDYFGNRAAIDGDTAIVGAAYKSDIGDKSGSAYIFVREGDFWVEQQKLTSSDAAANDEFGSDVAISGDTVIVGAQCRDDNAEVHIGAAYIFVRNGDTWFEQQKFTASNAEAGDRFGTGVAINGDYALVGANWANHSGKVNAGAAYVFVRQGDTWFEQQKLTASDAATGDWFGVSVAISENTAIVGAHFDEDAGNDTGSAYIFVRDGDTWFEQQKLVASDAAPDSDFGISVAIDGDIAVVGAAYAEHGTGTNGINRGSAYFFARDRETWHEGWTALASDAMAGDTFGGSVAISGDLVIVGATQSLRNGKGEAYIYHLPDAPPWYTSRWVAVLAIGFGVVVVIGLSFFILQYFRQRLEAQRLRDRMLQQERENRQILEQKNSELEAANQAKNLFLASMSHEIRTPLNAIIGYSQILQRDSDLNQRQRDAVDSIGNSGKHLLALINDILELSRIEAGHLELQPIDFNLKTFIAEISAMFQLRCERKGLNYRVEVETQSRENIRVRGDEGKLRQILINLLSNAVKFTESGGIVLRVNEEKTESNLFRFEVIDTGTGISPEELEAIFEMFQQGEEGVKRGGAGLGLAISQKQVELMGGELSVESPVLNPPQFDGERTDTGSGLEFSPSERRLSRPEELGLSRPERSYRNPYQNQANGLGNQGGSRFFFTIPLPTAAKTERADESSKQVLRLKEGYSVKALVADDNKQNSDVLGQILSDIGVAVSFAANGQEALDAVRAEMPDIVFMDIRMPVMDGLEATQRIFQEFGDVESKNCPYIVAVSASTLEHERNQFMEFGFHAFIGKPIHAEQVYECLANLLRVEYEYDDSDHSIELEKIVLPTSLTERLREAAEFARVTELTEAMDEVRQIGEGGRLLAEQILSLSRNFDMEGILEILEAIEKE